jgi:serine acetyltransferase
VNCYNGEAFLREALESVLAQTYTDWELILWDDQSTDGSVAVFKSYPEPRFKYVSAERHVPLGEARDLAIRQATGGWLAFLDQDDLWHAEKLARQIDLIDSDGGADLGLVYGRTVRFGASGAERDYDHYHEFRPLPEGHILPDLMRLSNFIAISSAMIPRQVYTETGGIPPGYEVAPEFYLFAAICSTRRARALQEDCTRYRVHASNMSRTTRMRSHVEALGVLERWSASIDPKVYERRRREYQTLIGWEDLRAGRIGRGVARILEQGSLAYLLSRPFVRTFRGGRRVWHRLLSAGPSRRAAAAETGRTARISWGETRLRLREDAARLRGPLANGVAPRALCLVLYPPYLCILLHRLSHHLWTRGHGLGARLLWHLNILATGADIHPHCDLGGGLLIPNPVAISLSGRAGKNLTVMARAGLGGELSRREDVGAGPGLPFLGDDVGLAPHAGVLGPVTIGGGVRVAPGCVVTRNVPRGAVVSPFPPAPGPARAGGSLPEGASLEGSGAITWSETRRRLAKDRERLMRLAGQDGPAGLPSLLAAPYLCARLHRLSHYCFGRGWTRLASLFWQLNQLLTGADIHPRSSIGGGLAVPNPAGVSLDGVAGENLTVLALSGIGGALSMAEVSSSRPHLGDDVELGPQAAVAGGVHIGTGARLAPGTVVTDDVPPGTATEPPPPKFHHRPLDPGVPPSAPPPPGPGLSLVSLRQSVGEDVRRYLQEARVPQDKADTLRKRLSALLIPGVLAVLIYRLSHALHEKGWQRFAKSLHSLNLLVHKVDISPSSRVGGGFYLPHPTGIVFLGRAGRDLALYSHALCTSLGPPREPGSGDGPQLGDRVSVGVHSAVLGPVVVGDDVRVAFRVVLTRDAPAGSIVASRTMRTRSGPGAADLSDPGTATGEAEP